MCALKYHAKKGRAFQITEITDIIERREFREKELLWKELINLKRDREARFTDSEREWLPTQAERYWREEETRAEKSFPLKWVNYLRIKKNTDFQKHFNRGKRVFSPCLTLLYFPSKTMSMGIAVSKKHGKATKRNRIKRLLRAAFSSTCVNLEKNYSIIILPKVAEEYSYKSFEKSFLSCFKKVNSCRENWKDFSNF